MTSSSVESKILPGAVAVVTGAASGIGAALAVGLAKRGVSVALADVADCSHVAEHVREAGARAMAVATDVGDANSVEDLARAVYSEFGKTNLLFPNAGVVTFAPLLETPIAEWERAMRVNFFGVLNTVRAFVPRMVTQSDRRQIVITASGGGLVASNVLPLGAYIASKFALVGFAESLRLELAPAGIGVTALCPGGVKTGILDTAEYAPGAEHLHPKRPGGPTPGRETARRLEPRDVAEFVLRGTEDNPAYLITHPEMAPAIEARLAEQVAACHWAESAIGGS